MVVLVCLRIDFKGLPFLGEIFEHGVEYVAEIPVEDACLRVWCISDHIVVVPHDVEVPEPCHLFIDGLEIVPVGFLPVFALVISSVERVGVVDIVDRRYDLVETVLPEMLPDLFPAVLLQTYFYAF